MPNSEFRIVWCAFLSTYTPPNILPLIRQMAHSVNMAKEAEEELESDSAESKTKQATP